MTEALAFDLGQLQGDGVFGGGSLGPPQHPDQVVAQILPALFGGQELLQRRGSHRVVGIDLQDRAQRIHRRARLRQILLTDARAPTQEIGAFRGRLDQGHLLVEQVAQLCPRLPALQGFLEEFRGRPVARLGLQVAPVVTAGGFAITQLLVVNPNGHADQGQHLVGIGQLVGEELVEQLAHIAPATELGRQAQQPLLRRPIGGLLLEHASVPVESLV